MALDTVTDFTDQRKSAIISLVNFSVSNACIHYRDKWFKMIEGLPTGASDSVALANIYVKWVLILFHRDKIASTSSKYILSLFRFIDDLFGGWSGTRRQFDQFITTFNCFGLKYGIVFDKHQFGSSVSFLDVLVSNDCGTLVTDLYIKPTDARRYLHRTSFHPSHAFHSIPFSQMRRAALICSNDYLREFAINDMCKQFLACGYNESCISKARLKVSLLDRSLLLTEKKSLVPILTAPLFMF